MLKEKRRFNYVLLVMVLVLLGVVVYLLSKG